MSLAIDGIWKAGVWATTVWSDGIWFEGGAAVVEATPSVGSNNFWIKGKKRFPRPRYWWEKDPETVPEHIPLADDLEELEQEEKELELYISELPDDGIADKILTVLHAYAEIIKEQAEMKRESVRIQNERNIEINKIATKKRRREKAISLLLG